MSAGGVRPLRLGAAFVLDLAAFPARVLTVRNRAAAVSARLVERVADLPRASPPAPSGLDGHRSA